MSSGIQAAFPQGGDGADPAAKVKPRRFRETARELNRPKSGPVLWPEEGAKEGEGAFSETAVENEARSWVGVGWRAGDQSGFGLGNRGMGGICKREQRKEQTQCERLSWMHKAS